ncbi:MAG: pro-sigmaK processing inhibitor BofA family protein [Oscillospiraceae bacterium]|jgi:inhibitor of the pro-sigma K processing machinery
MEQLGFLPYLLIGVFGIGVLFVFRSSLKGMARLVARMAASLGLLAVFSSVGSVIGVTLGVNLLNAFIMALLGVPGFGLLLLLRWTFLA